MASPSSSQKQPAVTSDPAPYEVLPRVEAAVSSDPLPDFIPIVSTPSPPPLSPVIRARSPTDSSSASSESSALADTAKLDNPQADTAPSSAANDAPPSLQPVPPNTRLIEDVVLIDEGFSIPTEDGSRGPESNFQRTESTEQSAESTPTRAESTRKPAESTLKPAESTLKPVESTLKPAESNLKPAGSTLKPAESNLKPAGSTVKPAQSTLKPVQSTLKPAQSTSKPAQSTSKPAQSTSKPAGSTSKPAESNLKPAGSTSKPAESNLKPAGSTVKPAQSTVKPAQSTSKPAQSTSKPAQSTSKPAQSTFKPARSTEKRVESIPKLVESTPKLAGSIPRLPESISQAAESVEKPAESVQQPAERAQQPVESAQQPAESAQQPVESAQQPAESAQQPVESAQQPAESAQQPAESAQQPAESAQQPAESAQQPTESVQPPSKSAPWSAGNAVETPATTPEPTEPCADDMSPPAALLHPPGRPVDSPTHHPTSPDSPRLSSPQSSHSPVRDPPPLPLEQDYEFTEPPPNANDSPTCTPPGNPRAPHLPPVPIGPYINAEHVVDVEEEPELLSPVYVPSDTSSDVEFVSSRPATEVLSDYVRISLQQLPLRNTIVSVPAFTRETPFSADDKAVAAAIADIYRAQRDQRQANPNLLPSRPRVVLILTTNGARAGRWQDLLVGHTNLRTEVHLARRPTPLDPLFDGRDAVVTHVATALSAAKHHALTLRRVVLLVFDAAEDVASRAHASAVLVRDHYRALPQKVRPRILAIARKHVPEHMMPPLEYNLLSRFVSANVTQDAVWASSHGKGCRPIEAGLLDVEFLYYQVENPDVAYSRGPDKKRSAVSATPKDRRAFSDLDHLTEQVGPLGVATYHRRRGHKQTRRTNPRAVVPDKLCISDGDALLGLTHKALSLMNEIHLAYAASTKTDQLHAIVYAGRPMIACALCEVMRALPIFRGLCVRVVLGVRGGAGFEENGGDDDFYGSRWQGEDTDDEEISYFSAGETNVLVLASPFYAQGRARRPLPPTPLVLRFDGSMPDPEVDGGGGRCRVVTFREHSKKRSIANGEKRPVEQQEREDPMELEQPEGQENGTREKPERRENLQGGIVESMDVVKPDEEHGKRTKPAATSPRPSANRGLNRKQVASKEGDRDEEPGNVYHCLPPRPLLGPNLQSSKPSFLYRVLLFDICPLSRLEELQRAKVTGVEDFLLVFSKRLGERDLTAALQDAVFGTGNGSSASGNIKLDFQGSVMLTSEQVTQGRRFTEEVFSLILPSRNKKFIWDTVPLADENETRKETREAKIMKARRRYLLLPAKSSEKPSSDDDDLQIVAGPLKSHEAKKALSEKERLFRKYFCGDEVGKRGRRVLGPCEIDWTKVRSLLDLRDEENYRKESRKTDALGPDQHSALEGKFVFSTLSGGTFAMCGRLRHDVTPLSSLTRSRKFPLNEDGTLVKHDDLVYLVDVVASEKTISQQAAVSEHETIGSDSGDDGKENSSRKEQPHRTGSPLPGPQKRGRKKSAVLSPAKWCQKRTCLVLDTCITGKKRKRDSGMKFDCERNVAKKRRTWVGRVRYSNETYFNKYYPNPIRYLDQPLLEAARPCAVSFEQLCEVARGTPMPVLFDRLVSKGTERCLLVPELCRTFPLSVGAALLPPVLFLLEHHLSVCELREYFDSKTKVKGTVGELLQAVTSTSVNAGRNYERLELLGDSVLKLSCTVRLFTKHPHYSEGQMHHERQYLVSNARLHKLGLSIGLHNYLRFQIENMADWRPPGTDLNGRAQKVTLKGLADVVEAICGAYFLFGSRMDDEKKEAVEVLESQKPGSESDWEIDLTYESSTDDSELEEREADTCNSAKDGSATVTVKEENTIAKQNQRRNAKAKGVSPLAAASVEKGYIAACKCLEACHVFSHHEPSHSEILLSAAHAMLPKGCPAPQELTGDAFPKDDRISHPQRPWEEEFEVLEGHIGYKFKRRPLLLCALTHGSYVTKDRKVVGDEQTFQRLEFLGDAVADFCVVRYLYERYPELGPGELTNLKSNVVSNEAFARTTVALGLHKFLCHTSEAIKEEIDSYIGTVQQDLTGDDDLGAHGAFKKSLGEIAAPKVLGDIFEAILGAIYVDSGLQQAWRICMKLLTDSLRINADPRRDDMHPVSELNELCTKVWKLGQAPRYETRNSHRVMKGSTKKARLGSRKISCVSILGEPVEEGHGSTEKRAKLKAAVAAMKLLNANDATSRGGKLLRRLKEKSVRMRVAEQRNPKA